MSNSLMSLAVVAILAIAASLASREEKCCEDECNTVRIIRTKIEETLTTKYGMSREEAEKIASDLMSGNTHLASTAAKKIAEVGAFNDVMDIIATTTSREID